MFGPFGACVSLAFSVCEHAHVLYVCVGAVGPRPASLESVVVQWGLA